MKGQLITGKCVTCGAKATGIYRGKRYCTECYDVKIYFARMERIRKKSIRKKKEDSIK